MSFKEELMPLTRQIIMIFIGALLLLFLCTFFITVQHVKGYFEEQLSSNAQDSATALGLTVSKQFEEEAGKAMMLAKVKAVFDRGYFNAIEVTDINGNIIVKRYTKSHPEITPEWFRSLVPIENKEKSALIMDGWRQVGQVKVRTNPALAYESLWQTAVYLFFLFLILTIVLSFIGGFIIHNLLQPLKLIIQQAKDIGKKRLYLLTVNLRTKELKDLSTTINEMVEKLQKIFAEQLVETEELRLKAYVDALTDLGNRRYFFQQLDNFLNSEEKYNGGFLVLIELEGLVEFNQKQGYHRGDQLLKAFANVIKNVLKQQNVRMTSRLEGPHFSFILLDVNSKPAEQLLNELYKKLQDMILTYDDNLACSISAARHQFSMNASNLIEQADQLLQLAKKNKETSIYIQEPNAHEIKLELIHSEQQIKEIIETKNFNIYTQPVKSETGLFHHEAYIKLSTSSGDIPARIFIPIAEKIGYGHKIDEYMLSTIIEQVKNGQVIGINLTPSIVHNKKRWETFFDLMKGHQGIHQQIQFEISEELLSFNKELSMEFISELNRMGFKVGLDHVGATLLSFDYFKNLDISYLKLDGTLSKDLTKSDYKKKIIKNLVNICENLKISLIATQIESEAEWRILKDLGIVWFQGNYIGKPIFTSAHG